jgi:hypothetical protein
MNPINLGVNPRSRVVLNYTANPPGVQALDQRNDGSGLYFDVEAVISETPFTPITATGGDSVYDITQNGVEYRVHEFLTTGTSTFDVTDFGSYPYVEFLIIAGGGAGGSGFYGGAGGAGGYREYSGVITPHPLGAQSFPVIVGEGAVIWVDQNGKNSSVFEIESAGGGCGGVPGGGQPAGDGKDGGSGGANNSESSAYINGKGNVPPTNPPQGFDAGGPVAGVDFPPGGGAGGPPLGIWGTSQGGIGRYSAITGTMIGRGEGGAGEDRGLWPPAVPIMGGGYNKPYIPPEPNRGGGGGSNTDQSGGSGIVIIRYPLSAISVPPSSTLTFPGTGFQSGYTVYNNGTEVQDVQCFGNEGRMISTDQSLYHTNRYQGIPLADLRVHFWAEVNGVRYIPPYIGNVTLTTSISSVNVGDTITLTATHDGTANASNSNIVYTWIVPNVSEAPETTTSNTLTWPTRWQEDAGDYQVIISITDITGNEVASNIVNITSTAPSYPHPLGGDEVLTYIEGTKGWKAHIFKADGDFDVSNDIHPNRKLEYLIVGGGGGAGSYYGSAGGAGGYLEGKITDLPAATYPIVVGSGGGSTLVPGSPGGIGDNGGESSFYSIIASGGGGGGYTNGAGDLASGKAGASGGGGCGGLPGTGRPGGSGIPGQGNKGEDGSDGIRGAGGGAASDGGPIGNGGKGKYSSITGVSVGYAGGGGGKNDAFGGVPGTASEGGGVYNASGAPNSGGGGGGDGGVGGSGIVVIRYRI